MNEKRVWMLSSQTATGARARFSRSQRVGGHRSSRDHGVGEISKEQIVAWESARSTPGLQAAWKTVTPTKKTEKDKQEGKPQRVVCQKPRGKDQVVAGAASRPEAWDTSIEELWNVCRSAAFRALPHAVLWERS